MTVNPVDMQVILQQTGQVNKVQRGMQFQQQVDQQILGQQIQQDMKNKENIVQHLSHVEHNKIENNDSQNKKRREKQMSSKKNAAKALENEEKKEENPPGSEHVGTLLDIKV